MLGETGMQRGKDAWWLGAMCGLCRDTQISTNPVLGFVRHWSLPAMGFSCQRLVGAGSICYLPWQTPPHRQSLEPAWGATGTLLPVDVLLLPWELPWGHGERRQFWGQFGAILGPFWGDFRVNLGGFWGHFWGNFRRILGSLLGPF